MLQTCTTIRLVDIDQVRLIVSVPRSPLRGVLLDPSRLLVGEGKKTRTERIKGL